jgi:glycosyltransferase involved in cell wall biosynthesis
VGSDEVSYGKPPPGGLTWRRQMLKEVEIDPARVHFPGVLPYADYLRLLQVSAAHVYLTVPFVLSWSMLEAMSVGCLIIGSATPPVQEVIEDEKNGLLVDFFAPEMIAARVVDALEHPSRYTAVRAAARWTALSRYSLERCLPPQIALLNTLTQGNAPVAD